MQYDIFFVCQVDDEHSSQIEDSGLDNSKSLVAFIVLLL